MAQRYLAVRTDRTKQSFLMRELKDGRLRQGWGYDRCQDLRRVSEKREAKEELNEDEQSAWRNRRLLDSQHDGVKRGDVLLLPNLPENGLWVLARVAGPYTFAISSESSDVGPDYGHIVHVEPVCDRQGRIATVQPHNEMVDAHLRATMRCQSRIWSIDALGEAVDRILSSIEAGTNTSAAQPDIQKLEGFFDSIREMAWHSITERYKGAEFEKLVVELFRRIYAGGKVVHSGGASEHGADILIITRDALGLEYKIAVQVKLHEGTHAETTALDQIREARAIHRVDAGVVVTTAKTTSPEFERYRSRLEDELAIDIRIITLDEFIGLVLAHLGPHTL